MAARAAPGAWRRRWTLNWEAYASKEKIDTRGNLITFVLGFEPHEGSHAADLSLEAWLKELGYEVERRSVGPTEAPLDTMVVARRKAQEVKFGDDFGWLGIRCQGGRAHEEVSGWLDQLDIDGFLFAGEVVHGVRRSRLDTLGTLTEHVGRVETEAEPDLYPFRFLELRRGRKLIAKMLVSYFNHEMAEAAPTMELLEVIEEERGKGIGTAMIRFAESVAEGEGFDRIWGTDADLSLRLLKKLGYDDDLEECVKYF